ncbi:Gfo/Idh/MocA family oxidoreductase (plasmid) [Rhodovastum atsumiense]|nr:Gfo/Idh/MocA family oxidoreductase [Rhodovastum atsumiense]CAH2605704.1 Gfo/Idh/MocA family oxidoreductase [Rhodovastum atsumiense]
MDWTKGTNACSYREQARQRRKPQFMTLKRNDVPARSSQCNGRPDHAVALLRMQGEHDVLPHYGLDRRPETAGLRVAVVGCGYWGSKHVRVLSATPGVAGITLIEQDLALARSLQVRFPTTTICTSLNEALPYVDAVVIATPPESHGELALAALRARKPVLVEKPLTTSLDEARLLVAEARRSGALLMVGHTFQFNPAVRELRRRLQAGELGEIYYIHSARLNLGLYRPDVNVIWDLAPHDISILNFLLDAVPRSVDAWGASLAFGGIEDMAYVKLQYDDPKVTGYVHLSWLDPRKTRTVTIVGSRKMAVYDDMAEEPLRIFDRSVHGHEGSPPSHERPAMYRYGDIVAPYIRPDEPLALQDRHFIDSIRQNRVPEASGEQALGIIAALEAIDRSMRNRGQVTVPSLAELEPRRDMRPPVGDRHAEASSTEMR